MPPTPNMPPRPQGPQGPQSAQAGITQIIANVEQLQLAVARVSALITADPETATQQVVVLTGLLDALAGQIVLAGPAVAALQTQVASLPSAPKTE